MKMHWNIGRPDPNLVTQIQQRLNCHAITARVLANRAIASAEEAALFFQPSLKDLPSPEGLLSMEAALERIYRAITRNEKILVFGDYDADGVTATALLVSFLRSIGADVLHHLPHRMHEGYGLQSAHIVQLAVPGKIGLIITVDCGSSSLEAVAAARRFGIDVIITDHHTIGPEIPDAVAVINPKREGQLADLADLAGVGVAFYLAIGLRMYLRTKGWWTNSSEPNLKNYCDLVAVGTIADMVPLSGVNRVLTRVGLAQINAGIRPGLEALLAVSAVRQKPVTAEDIAYRLAPRINAAGRMASAKIAYDLLTQTSLNEALGLAEALNGLNQRRQSVESAIIDQITARIDKSHDLMSRNSLVLADPNWHEGVLGIVAAKLALRYYRPVIVISIKEGVAKGSGRSTPHVDLHAALVRCSALLERFGGHRQAAGVTLNTDNIDRFRAAFEAVVAEMTQSERQLPQLKVDSEIRFDQICPQLVDELERLAPFGTDNPSPIFMARDVRVTDAAIIGQRHRRMMVCQPAQTTVPFSAIEFNLPPDAPRPGSFDRLAFRLQWNRYKNNKEIQMVVEAY
jgi:single-stranded-DNA-specific exonuclease